jgi:hypothetical protein
MSLIYTHNGWLWISPSIENILFVFTLCVLGDITIELIWFSKHKETTLQPIWSRFFSFSHLTGFFGVLMVLFEVSLFRALILSVFPFLLIFFYIVFFVIKSERKREYKQWAIKTHIWHFIFLSIMFVKQWWAPWYEMIFAGIFWNMVLLGLWLKNHSYKMMFTITLKNMFLITNISVLFFTILMYFIY